jgi:hypothetical protein
LRATREPPPAGFRRRGRFSCLIAGARRRASRRLRAGFGGAAPRDCSLGPLRQVESPVRGLGEPANLSLRAGWRYLAAGVSRNAIQTIEVVTEADRRRLTPIGAD